VILKNKTKENDSMEEIPTLRRMPELIVESHVSDPEPKSE
jgi:hypothetical protein